MSSYFLYISHIFPPHGAMTSPSIDTPPSPRRLAQRREGAAGAAERRDVAELRRVQAAEVAAEVAVPSGGDRGGAVWWIFRCFSGKNMEKMGKIWKHI